MYCDVHFSRKYKCYVFAKPSVVDWCDVNVGVRVGWRMKDQLKREIYISILFWYEKSTFITSQEWWIGNCPTMVFHLTPGRNAISKWSRKGWNKFGCGWGELGWFCYRCLFEGPFFIWPEYSRTFPKAVSLNVNFLIGMCRIAKLCRVGGNRYQKS